MQHKVISNYLNITKVMMPQKRIKLYNGIRTWMPFWDRTASVGKEDFKTVFIRKEKKVSTTQNEKWPFPWRFLNLIYLASLRQEMHYNAQDGGKWQFNDYGTSFTFHGNWTISTSKSELVAFWKMERHFAFFSLFTTSLNFSIFSGFIFPF